MYMYVYIYIYIYIYVCIYIYIYIHILSWPCGVAGLSPVLHVDSSGSIRAYTT